ncbi:MAG: hypothetical protein A2X94_12435 [Bdellovibrionales bacterium GWB1_55_8]|nr:MAG: hypothetical protein A2X94_12435 [Bdellovibrionales bacterium GWB1_55_8]
MKTVFRSCTPLALIIFSGWFAGCSNPFGAVGKIDPVYKPGYAVKPPMVSSVLPNAGSLQGGTLLTVLGSSFESGATVEIGGQPCRATHFISDTKLTCVVPGHTAGLVDLKVTNPDSQSFTLSSAFNYVGSANPVAGFAATTGGGISQGGGFRLSGTAGITGNPVQQSGNGFQAKTGLQGALHRH